MTAPPRRALVVYGSETGNAQDVAEELGRITQRLRFDTEVAELNAISLVCAPMAAVSSRDSYPYLRNNYCNTRSFSYQSPPPARASSPQTLRTSGEPFGAPDCRLDVCSS